MARRDLPRPQRSPLLPQPGPASPLGSPGLRGLTRPLAVGPLSCFSLGLFLAGLTLGLVGAAARAQAPSPNQPLAIDGLPPPPCPLLVPASDAALQPLRIQPSQVAGKNAAGCLSPADAALYGPDGCPVKLCHAPQGTVPLPQF